MDLNPEELTNCAQMAFNVTQQCPLLGIYVCTDARLPLVTCDKLRKCLLLFYAIKHIVTSHVSRVTQGEINGFLKL